MNVTVNAQALAGDVKILSKIAAAKPTIPITGHLLLRAEGANNLYMAATDLEIALSTDCAADVHESGAITLPAKMLLDVLERVPSGDININNGRLTAGNYKARLASLHPDDFTPMADVVGEPAKIPARSLRLLIERTRYAISEKPTQYAMMGALLSLTKNVVAMVSTDGKRLAIATASREDGPEYQVIIPSKTLDALLAQPAVGDVMFSRGDRHLFFQYERRLLTSRMVDGEFPRYQRVIPRENKHRFATSKAVFASALSRVGLVSDVINLAFSAGRVELSARSAEFGDAHETVEASYDGPDIRMAVNWKYLMDFLERGAENTATIDLKDAKSPLLMTDGSDFINVMMTIREG
jgi:DNA polymerase-3 subunit beta